MGMFSLDEQLEGMSGEVLCKHFLSNRQIQEIVNYYNNFLRCKMEACNEKLNREHPDKNSQVRFGGGK